MAKAIPFKFVLILYALRKYVLFVIFNFTEPEPLAIFKNSIARVNVYLFHTGAKRDNHIHICHKFIQCTSFTGVVTCCSLNTGGKWTILVKAFNIITLPTMK